MDTLAKTIIFIGVILIVIGLLVMGGSRFGLGRLPGDIFLKRGRLTIYFPIVTSIIISIILSFLLNTFFRNR
ncbi:DUF2905 domain-containing protein [Serpentinicella sp. ANB-PHB4]|uniref:DUF2905 domain-containing protein n=1 Tax=Serpentinicella sp. ANB-PHB4 TaxID=3074076 RepID=UPI002863BD49|nr:DUF2905 domain-containing protein [Serpentinicella sp. ANB-PHB4]MDR5658057.1 DUF2905 domain-containing protein [Serpentinicella sp. ANB-PHB4]